MLSGMPAHHSYRSSGGDGLSAPAQRGAMVMKYANFTSNYCAFSEATLAFTLKVSDREPGRGLAKDLISRSRAGSALMFFGA